MGSLRPERQSFVRPYRQGRIVSLIHMERCADWGVSPRLGHDLDMAAVFRAKLDCGEARLREGRRCLGGVKRQRDWRPAN